MLGPTRSRDYQLGDQVNRGPAGFTATGEGVRDGDEAWSHQVLHCPSSGHTVHL
jgi:hypothetical protein